MSEFSHQLKYVRASEVSTCRHDDSAILYNPDTGREKIINRSAFSIWEKMDGNHSAEDIARSLLENYEGASFGNVFQDVCNFMSELLEVNFIEIARDNQQRLAAIEYPEISDRPGDFDISLTGKCNLHCDYCFYANEMHDRPDLPLKEWFTFFDELGRLAVRTLTLSGGEVFVRKDLFDLIDSIIEKRMRYSILTNGTLISEKTHFSFRWEKAKTKIEFHPGFHRRLLPGSSR